MRIQVLHKHITHRPRIVSAETEGALQSNNLLMLFQVLTKDPVHVIKVYLQDMLNM
jgi:hypothetical protein